MNKAELIDELTEKLGSDRRHATDAVENVVDTIVRAVHKGDSVTITGFGVFEQRRRAARVARNPRTGETVKVRPTSVPAFRPGAQFKAIVSGAQRLPSEGPAVKRGSGATVAVKKAAAKKAVRRAVVKKAVKRTAAKKAVQENGRQEGCEEGGRQEGCEENGRQEGCEEGSRQEGCEENGRQEGSQEGRQSRGRPRRRRPRRPRPRRHRPSAAVGKFSKSERRGRNARGGSGHCRRHRAVDVVGAHEFAVGQRQHPRAALAVAGLVRSIAGASATTGSSRE